MTSPPLIDVIHGACGGVAFRLTHRVTAANLDLSVVRLLDGTTPSAATPQLCGSCRRPFATDEVAPVSGWASSGD
jgi:hypothetical protein